MKFFFAIILIVLSSCSDTTFEKEVDIDELIQSNNYRTIEVDSTFQISFPQRFSKTESISDNAIVQFNDLSREEHLIIVNDEPNDFDLKETLKEITTINAITNEKIDSSENDKFEVERYTCDVSQNSFLGEYSFWLTRFKNSRVSYTLCLWTTTKNKEQFSKDVNNIERTFSLL